MADSNMVSQASQIWSMLDDMAENNPSAYRKFVDKHLKEGKEYHSSPQPHMCIQTCILSNWIPVYINFCEWVRMTKPSNDDDPIPVFGSKFVEKSDETEGVHHVVHLAFHPEVLEQFGLKCKSKQHQDMLIQLGIDYLEDQHKLKLSRSYNIIEGKFKGSLDSIQTDFGLTENSMDDMMKKLANSFAPVADISNKDPSILSTINEKSNNLHQKGTTEPELLLPNSPPKASKQNLIEEMKTTPIYDLKIVEFDERKIVIKINLSDVTDVSECELDVTQESLTLQTSSYHLQLTLPEEVNQDKVKARFSKSREQLTVTLPILVQS